jgi:hypothetical protein
MRQRWEYLTVLRLYETAQDDFPGKTWTENFWIYRPGDEEGQKREAHSGSSKEPEYKVTIRDIFAELGAEGWELVSETVLDTTIVAGGLGWTDVAIPVRMRWTFKRPAD